MEVAANTKAIEAIKATGKDERYSVAGIDNLWLNVSAKGRKVWAWRGRIAGGAPKKFTLGPFTSYNLAQAKDWAGQINVAKGQGRDLIEEKKSEKVEAEKVQAEAEEIEAKTVDWLFDLYMEKEGGERRKADEKRRCYEKDIKPWVGTMSIHSVTHEDLDDVVAEKAATAKTQAIHVRNYIRRLFRWAVTGGRRESGLKTNPAADLPRPGEFKKKDRYLTDYEIGLFLRAMEEPQPKYASYAQGWWLILHTGVRRDEAFGAPFDEFDFAKGEWLIPGERTKNGEELLLPLPSAIIDRMRGINREEGQRLLWHTISKKGEQVQLSGWTTAQKALMKRMNELAAPDGKEVAPFTAHDLRRTLSTGMNGLLDEDDYPLIAPMTVERILNHTIKGVGGLYNRHAYYKEKKVALQLWADHLEGIRKEGEERLARAA